LSSDSERLAAADDAQSKDRVQSGVKEAVELMTSDQPEKRKEGLARALKAFSSMEEESTP